MKQIISLMLTLCLVLPVSAAGTSAVEIGAVEELLAFGARLADEPGLDGVLTADLDAAGLDWTPLGGPTVRYRGTLDGNGHTISNLRGKGAFLSALGPGGVLKNLTLANVDLETSGGLVNSCNGWIENCAISGKISGKNLMDTGGIAADVGEDFTDAARGRYNTFAPGTLLNCRSSLEIRCLVTEDGDQGNGTYLHAAYYHAGGVAGKVTGGSIVDGCQFSGRIQVEGPMLGCNVSIGGVVGRAGLGETVANCGNSGEILGQFYRNGDGAFHAGGIVGSGSGAGIWNCWNTGKVSVKAPDVVVDCNGIMGNTLSDVKNCWSSGPVEISGYRELYPNARIGSSSCYFLEGADFCTGNSPTFSRNELADGGLTAKLNAYVSSHPGQRLRTWRQGSGGPEIEPAAPHPSDWAEGYVREAMEHNLVPAALWENYAQPITRKEFCALAVRVYETVTGQITGGLLDFRDTTDGNMRKAGYLGILTGTGDGVADPGGTLTREQAAVMLAALSKACGAPLPTRGHTFPDPDISAWAREAVGQVQGAGIMSGSGAGRFSPKDPYTREQSIVTMLAVFRSVNGAAANL